VFGGVGIRLREGFGLVFFFGFGVGFGVFGGDIVYIYTYVCGSTQRNTAQHTVQHSIQAHSEGANGMHDLPPVQHQCAYLEFPRRGNSDQIVHDANS
jgi:hypothetical protein